MAPDFTLQYGLAASETCLFIEPCRAHKVRARNIIREPDDAWVETQIIINYDNLLIVQANARNATFFESVWASLSHSQVVFTRSFLLRDKLHKIRSCIGPLKTLSN